MRIVGICRLSVFISKIVRVSPIYRTIRREYTGSVWNGGGFMAVFQHEQDNQVNEYTVTIESGETTYITKAVFIGNDTLNDVIKHRILKEYTDYYNIVNHHINPME